MNRPTHQQLEDLQAQGYTLRDLAVLLQVREDQVQAILDETEDDDAHD